jgi:osmotically-inducible protein OsmY
MLKTICNNVLWIAVPLGLAMGCAENRPQAEATYSTPPNVVLQPTSSRPDQQVYNNSTDSGAPVDTSDFTAPPAGANPSSWAINEEIREKLMTDKSLAPFGSSLIAQVSPDGKVTLRGNVSSASEQQRVADSIASLPGVRGVDNQLNVGKDYQNKTINTEQPINTNP